MNQKIVNKYIRQIKRTYRGNRRVKKQFITELRDALLCFGEEHPDSSYSDLLQEFGKPSECKELLNFSGAESLQKRNLFLYWTVNTVIIIAVTILVLFTVRHVITSYEYAHGYYIIINGEDNNINPFTGETNPPPKKHIDLD